MERWLNEPVILKGGMPKAFMIISNRIQMIITILWWGENCDVLRIKIRGRKTVYFKLQLQFGLPSILGRKLNLLSKYYWTYVFLLNSAVILEVVLGKLSISINSCKNCSLQNDFEQIKVF